MDPHDPTYEVVQFFREKQKGGSRMETLLGLIKDSTIAQGFITAACVLSTCYLWVTGQEVPQELWTMDTIVIGYFFGSKTWKAKK